jgi:hypothetical protein
VEGHTLDETVSLEWVVGYTEVNLEAMVQKRRSGTWSEAQLFPIWLWELNRFNKPNNPVGFGGGSHTLPPHPLDMTEVAEKRGGNKGKNPTLGVGFFSGASDSWIREHLNV